MTRIDTLAFTIMNLKLIIGLTGDDPEKMSDAEKALRAEWEAYPAEERDKALERALDYYGGGTLKPMVEGFKAGTLLRSYAVPSHIQDDE